MITVVWDFIGQFLFQSLLSVAIFWWHLSTMVTPVCEHYASSLALVSFWWYSWCYNLLRKIIYTSILVELWDLLIDLWLNQLLYVCCYIKVTRSMQKVLKHWTAGHSILSKVTNCECETCSGLGWCMFSGLVIAFYLFFF